MKRPPPRSVLARRSPCAGLRFVLLAASALLRLATALLAGASGATRTTSSSASSSRPAREVGGESSAASAVETQAAAAVGLGSDDSVVLPDFNSYNVQADVMSTPLIHSGSPSGYLRRTADEEAVDAGRESSFSDAAAREASGRVEEVVQGPHPPVIRHLRSTSGAGSSTATVLPVDDGARTSTLGLATAASSGSPPHTPVQQVEVQPHQAQERQLAAAPAVPAAPATLPLGGHQRRPAPGQQQRRIPNPRAPTARNGFDSRFAGRPHASVRFFLGNTDSPGGSPGVVVRDSVSNEAGPQQAAAVEVADDPFGLQTISTQQAHQRSRAPTNLGRFGGAGLQVVNGEVVAAIDENASELSSEVPSQITSQPSQATLSSGASSGVLLRAFRLQTPRIFGNRYGQENSADPYLYRNALTGSTRDLMQPPARAGGDGDRNEAGIEGATGARGQPHATRAGGQESQSQEPSTTSASVARVNPAAHQRQPTSSLERVLLPTRRLLGYLSAGPSGAGGPEEAEPDVERAGAPTPGGNNRRIGRVNRSGTRRDHHVFFDEDEAVQPDSSAAAPFRTAMSSLLRSASTTAAGAVSAGGRLLLPGIVPGGGIIGGSTAPAAFPSDRMSPSLRDGSRSLQDGAHERLALASRAAPSAMGGLGVVQGRRRGDSEDHSGALPLSSRASNRASTAGSISSFASAAVGWMPSTSTSGRGPRTGRKQSTLSTAFPSSGEVPPGDSDAEMEVDPDVSKDEADASEVSSEPAQCAICLGALDEESSELSRSDTALLADRGDDGQADAARGASREEDSRGSADANADASDPRESSHRPRQNAASSSASSSQETSAPRPPPPPPTPPEGTTRTRQVAGEVPLMKQKVFIPTCAHKSATLHRECLKTWILKRNGNSQKCPICRTKMSFEFLQAMIHDQELPTTVSDAHLRELAREQSSQAERQRAATERAAIAQAPQQQRMRTDGAADFSMEADLTRLEALAEQCTNCCIDTVAGCCSELCCKDPRPCAACVCCGIIYCCDAGTKWAVHQRAACLHEMWPKHAQIFVRIPGENGTTTRHVHFGLNENMLQSFRGYNQGFSTFLYVSEEVVGGEEDSEAGSGRRQYGAWKPLNFERAAKTLAEIDWEEEQSRPSCTEGKAKCDAEDVEQAYIRCMQKFDGPMDVSIRRRKNPHVAKNTLSSAGGTHAFLGPAGNNLASAPASSSSSSSSGGGAASSSAASAGSAEGAKEQDHQHQTVVK